MLIVLGVAPNQYLERLDSEKKGKKIQRIITTINLYPMKRCHNQYPAWLSPILHLLTILEAQCQTSIQLPREVYNLYKASWSVERTVPSMHLQIEF